MLTQLGNGWFVRNNYGGVDAWNVYAVLGNTTLIGQDIKLSTMLVIQPIRMPTTSMHILLRLRRRWASVLA